MLCLLSCSRRHRDFHLFDTRHQNVSLYVSGVPRQLSTVQYHFDGTVATLLSCKESQFSLNVRLLI
jgi:hypothetical protein